MWRASLRLAMSDNPASWIGRAELLVKTSAGLLAVVYGAGFIVVSWHHASFGINSFELLRPRVLSAGVSFVVLTGLPALTALRSFGLGGFTTGIGTGISASPNRRGRLKVVLAVALYPFVYGIAAQLVGFFERTHDGEIQPWQTLPFTLALLIGAQIAKKHFDSYPGLITLGVSALVLWFFIISLHFADSTPLALSGWFYLVGLLAAWLGHNSGRTLESFKGWSWEYHLPVIVGVLLFYSHSIYGRLKPECGGGSPIPATLYLSEAMQMIGDQRRVPIYLLDETPDGFFVLLSKRDPNGVFIQRSKVESIDFRNQTPLSRK